MTEGKEGKESSEKLRVIRVILEMKGEADTLKEELDTMRLVVAVVVLLLLCFIVLGAWRIIPICFC